MKFGLKQEHLELLNQIFCKHLPTDAQVYIYGSRVKGTFHRRSDLDLVIKNMPADRHQLSELLSAIDDSNFPLLCDLQYYSTINNPSLKDHIDRLGQPFPKTNSTEANSL
jgi:predicted nucleotidyltransferase